jgi:hypothetical protein
MSETTLYSSLYQQISEYAELVDEALIALIGQENDTRLFQQLGKLLEQLANPPQGQLASRMVSELILDSDMVGQSELEMAAQALRAGDIDDVTREIIERLARSLEQERTKVMARIRGERR